VIADLPVTSARSLAEAYALLGQRPAGLRVLAGGTDLMVQIGARVGLREIGHVLDVWRIPELRGVDLSGGVLRLGALTTYSELLRSPLVQQALPALAQVSREVGAWAIQNRGTVGGNVCNASPAGDTLPIMIAAGASFLIGGPRGERSVPADEFFLAYRKTALQGDELLLRIDAPALGADEKLLYRKVGTRRAQSIAKTLIAVRAALRAGELRSVRVAAGCVAPVPLRCRQVEAALEGRAPDAAALRAARAALEAEIAPIDDVRSTAAYRRRVSGNVLERLALEMAQGA
jgi:CO/xanthine dehydrogenase FAD-binding subunit